MVLDAWLVDASAVTQFIAFVGGSSSSCLGVAGWTRLFAAALMMHRPGWDVLTGKGTSPLRPEARVAHAWDRLEPGVTRRRGCPHRRTALHEHPRQGARQERFVAAVVWLGGGGLGHWTWLLLLLSFSRPRTMPPSTALRKKGEGMSESGDGSRSWTNVVANGGMPGWSFWWLSALMRTLPVSGFALLWPGDLRHVGL